MLMPAYNKNLIHILPRSRAQVSAVAAACSESGKGNGPDYTAGAQGNVLAANNLGLAKRQMAARCSKSVK